MRELPVLPNSFTKVVVLDEPGQGNACHEYYINKNKPTTPKGLFGDFGYVHFQSGPIKEKGVNGCQQEDLLIIVIDRLESFQTGDFACNENSLALESLKDALKWLNKRTSDRVARGVEGTNTL